MKQYYKAYIKENGTYSFPFVEQNIENIFKKFDIAIINESIKEMIIVKHNVELNMDEIVYSYFGDINDYIIFKEKVLLDQDKILEQYYEFESSKKIKKKEK